LQKCYHNIVFFRKAPIFFTENWQKSQKIALITSTPDAQVSIFAIFNFLGLFPGVCGRRLACETQETQTVCHRNEGEKNRMATVAHSVTRTGEISLFGRYIVWPWAHFFLKNISQMVLAQFLSKNRPRITLISTRFGLLFVLNSLILARNLFGQKFLFTRYGSLLGDVWTKLGASIAKSLVTLVAQNAEWLNDFSAFQDTFSLEQLQL
jgi:hypothetical protein